MVTLVYTGKWLQELYFKPSSSCQTKLFNRIIIQDSLDNTSPTSYLHQTAVRQSCLPFLSSRWGCVLERCLMKDCMCRVLWASVRFLLVMYNEELCGHTLRIPVWHVCFLMWVHSMFVCSEAAYAYMTDTQALSSTRLLILDEWWMTPSLRGACLPLIAIHLSEISRCCGSP